MKQHTLCPCAASKTVSSPTFYEHPEMLIVLLIDVALYDV